MDGGAWRAAVHGAAESDATEQLGTYPLCRFRPGHVRDTVGSDGGPRPSQCVDVISIFEVLGVEAFMDTPKAGENPGAWMSGVIS